MKDNRQDDKSLISALQVDRSSVNSKTKAVNDQGMANALRPDLAEDGFRYDYDDASDLYRG